MDPGRMSRVTSEVAVLMSKTLPSPRGVVAMALLAGLQFIVAWLVSRSLRTERVVKSEPAPLYRKNGFFDRGDAAGPGARERAATGCAQ